jgi:hypothetical protein
MQVGRRLIASAIEVNAAVGPGATYPVTQGFERRATVEVRVENVPEERAGRFIAERNRVGRKASPAQVRKAALEAASELWNV